MGLVARFGFRVSDVRVADCTAAEAIGDFVYVSGPKILNRDQVRKVDPTDTNYDKKAAVGVITSKSTVTTCVVQWMGETPAVLTGLTPGRPCFVGTNAKATNVPPTPVSSGVFVHSIGQATASDRMYVRPSSPPIKRVL